MAIWKRVDFWIGLVSVGMIVDGVEMGVMASLGCGSLYATICIMLLGRRP